MSPNEAFLRTILRRICYAAAWLIYHAVTLYDKGCAVYAVFGTNATKDLETNHRFVYPPIRLYRYWHTTRLIRLGAGTGTEPLEGILLTNVTIRIFSWSWTFGERHYHAVSYCWGDGTLTKMIYLNGKLLPITETLHSALQSLRQQDSPVVLWADQICIDQSQDALGERSQQVQRMGEIYATADSVVIWLGKPTRFSDEIFHRLNMLDELRQADRANSADCLMPYSSPKDDINELISAILDGIYETPGFNEGQVKEELITGLNSLLNNAWFSRIWVLQEAVLAKDLFVQAGSLRVPWMRFVDCIGSIQDKTDRTVASVRLVYDVEMLRERRRLADDLEDGDLLTMVETFRGRQATDIRDKIYGLFGLTNTGLPGPAFTADYSKSPEQVFLEFALWHIQVNRRVDVLTKCCSEEVHDSSATGSEQRQLPSWCTDWSMTSSSDCGDLVDDYFLHRGVPQLFNASRSLRADARIVFNHQAASSSPTSNAVLVLSGVIVDTIAHVVNRLHTPGEDFDPSSKTWTEWKRFAVQERNLNPYGSRDGRMNAFWRTLIVDRMSSQERASSDIGLGFESMLGINDAIVDPVDTFSATRDSMFGSREAPSNEGENLSTNLEAWVRRWNSVHFGKRIFCTERGYLGISCEHVKKGDRVTVLWGGRLPFLLRKHGSVLLSGAKGRPSLADDTVVPTYRLIGGECYVHGLADGEGLDIAERLGMLPTKICLV